MNKHVRLLSELEKSVDQYIQEKGCSRKGRVECYLAFTEREKIARADIEKPKSNRVPSQSQLDKAEIEKYIIGNTLRRPCFDILFLPNGTVRATWNDGLWDTDTTLAGEIRAKLSLPEPRDLGDAVPVVHTGKWEWAADGKGIMRNFDMYPKPFLTEFFVQDNGLMTVKGHNDTGVIWYEMLPLLGDQLPKVFVDWSDMVNFTDVQRNLYWERAYNNGPQQSSGSTRAT